MEYVEFVNPIPKSNINDHLQNILSRVFGHLYFYRIKNDSTYSVFAANIQSFLADGVKYVMLIVPTSSVPTDKQSLNFSELPWVSVQTRTVSQPFTTSFADQALDPKALDYRYLPSQDRIKLYVRNRTNASTYYTTQDGSIEVTLLHDPKKKSVYQYADSLDILQALNTFQCVVKRRSYQTSQTLRIQE